jgi:dihydropteroate synthase
MGWTLGSSALLMGIVNVTPNSFSDGARFLDPADAIAHAKQLVADGAALLDLGAEATSFFRPGVEPVPADEQLRRLLPVVEGLRGLPGVRLSIDTRSSAVARACVAAGAHLINDVSAGEHDPEMLPTIAALRVPVVLMHLSACFPDDPPYDDPDILQTVRAALEARAAAALAAGVARENILLDPGLGFGKTMRDNLILALGFAHLPGMDWPVVLGASRKRFLQTATAPHYRGVAHLRQAAARLAANAGPEAHERDPLTAAIVAYHAGLPARLGGLIHRVHNVALAARALEPASRS